jgi:malate synthase
MSTGTGINAPGIEIKAPVNDSQAEILTPEALRFLASLAGEFDARRLELLARRKARQAEIDAGKFPDFLPETAEIRAAKWTVAPIPADLLDRRVEITGPVDRKMIINALNSGASMFMADLEDANSPVWLNNGQYNLRDAVNRVIDFTSPEGKTYKLNDKIAALLMRPRGWHLNEKHALVGGRPMSGSLFDFGLYFFHNAKNQMARGTGPYFYLPKLESHLEARLWNDVFNLAQDAPRGTIRAVLIETIFSAFEMDEILYELRGHSNGLNCGRWDYMFSFIKKFRNYPSFMLPKSQRSDDGAAFLEIVRRSADSNLPSPQHSRHGRHGPQVPIKNDPAANQQALDKVRADKLREVKAGHDGTWIAHPGLVPVAKEVFDEHMKGPSQIDCKREDVRVTAKDLLEVPTGTITETGLRWNIDVGLQYLEAWLRGVGCVPIYNLMEDAATAEICRAQVWQWVKHGAKLDDGRLVTAEMVRRDTDEQLEKLKSRATLTPGGRFADAGRIFEQMMTSAEFPEFLTLAAYGYLD